jgi:hypothetical protein
MSERGEGSDSDFSHNEHVEGSDSDFSHNEHEERSDDEGSVCGGEEITEHPISCKWKTRLFGMTEDICKRIHDTDDDLMLLMNITDPLEIKRWWDACMMPEDGHDEFNCFQSTSISCDVSEYVTHRVKHVITCLNKITGVLQMYVTTTYIKPWTEDMNDTWQWCGLYDKWESQLEYMKRDLMTRSEVSCLSLLRSIMELLCVRI